MRLLLENRQDKYYNRVLENVKGYEESFAERKIFVSYEDDRADESFSLIQYMAKEISEKEFMEFANKSLYYLGGALNNFYQEEVEQPQVTPAYISLYEDDKFIVRGKASEIMEGLRDKFGRKILKWDAYFHNVTLKI